MRFTLGWLKIHQLNFFAILAMMTVSVPDRLA
jgi:hypothetical protein